MYSHAIPRKSHDFSNAIETWLAVVCLLTPDEIIPNENGQPSPP